MTHELKVLSLHDAQAECSCGQWHYAFTGERTRADVEAKFAEHVSSCRDRHVVQLSDGRHVVIEAVQNGIVRVCLVYDTAPSNVDTWHWSGISATALPRHVYLWGESPERAAALLPSAHNAETVVLGHEQTRSRSKRVTHAWAPLVLIRRLRELYEGVLNATESFQGRDHIGPDLAYLMGAVLADSVCEWPPSRPIIKLIRSLPDLAWALDFIDLTDEQ